VQCGGKCIAIPFALSCGAHRGWPPKLPRLRGAEGEGRAGRGGDGLVSLGRSVARKDERRRFVQATSRFARV